MANCNGGKGIRVLSNDECVLVLNSLGGRDRVAVSLGLGAGLRFCEVFRLKWTDFDSDKRVLIMHRQKCNKTAYVSLPETLVSELKSYVASSAGELLFNDQTAESYLKHLRLLNGKIKNLLPGNPTFRALRNTFLMNSRALGTAV